MKIIKKHFTEKFLETKQILQVKVSSPYTSLFSCLFTSPVFLFHLSSSKPFYYSSPSFSFPISLFSFLFLFFLYMTSFLFSSSFIEDVILAFFKHVWFPSSLVLITGQLVLNFFSSFLSRLTYFSASLCLVLFFYFCPYFVPYFLHILFSTCSSVLCLHFHFLFLPSVILLDFLFDDQFSCCANVVIYIVTSHSSSEP